MQCGIIVLSPLSEDRKIDTRIVFSDVDGTLLDSRHRLSEKTLYSIKALQQKGIPFVIVSARAPSEIYPLHREYGFTSPVISYSGALIVDENGEVLRSEGFSKDTALEIIAFTEDNCLDCTWNIYSVDTWTVKDRSDARVRWIESIVKVSPTQADPKDMPENAVVSKVLLICNPECIIGIEKKLKAAFGGLTVVKSSDVLIEIMQGGTDKGNAVKTLCRLWDIPPEKTVAFGDNFNDIEMLEAVSVPFLMGNAPKELKSRFKNITDSNDDDGIYNALVKRGIIDPI